MHGTNPIAFAIPVFLLAIGLEVWVAKKRRASVYRFYDAVTDLSCGIGNQVTGLVLLSLELALFTWVYEHASLIHWAPGSPWPWVLAFVGVDFFYYWWHRHSHEVNFMWAAHIVHHQSEDYNLAVALRQAWFTRITTIPYYLPLAFLGVSPLALGASIAISLLYQFWIHTELINRIDPFEWILNSPSHHRVHHATNSEYLDKNYGAILITWDRMFGTFEPERAPCTYGITKPFGSWNPVWANFHYFGDIWDLAKRCDRFSDKLLAPFRRPGWDPKTRTVEVPSHVPREQFHKFEPPPVSRGLRRYIMLQFALLALGVVALLLWSSRLSTPQVVAGITAVVLATLAWGGLFERKRWAVPLEVARVVASVVVMVWTLTSLPAHSAPTPDSPSALQLDTLSKGG